MGPAWDSIVGVHTSMGDRGTPSRGNSARMSGCDIATKRQVQTNAQTDRQTGVQCAGRHRSRREELVGSPVCVVSREGSPVEDRARCVHGEERQKRDVDRSRSEMRGRGQ